MNQTNDCESNDFRISDDSSVWSDPYLTQTEPEPNPVHFSQNQSWDIRVFQSMRHTILVPPPPTYTSQQPQQINIFFKFPQLKPWCWHDLVAYFKALTKQGFLLQPSLYVYGSTNLSRLLMLSLISTKRLSLPLIWAVRLVCQVLRACSA